MSYRRTCLKGAVVVGLIAALTPGLWAQSPQERQPVTPPGGTDAPHPLTEAQQTATARRAMRRNKVSRRIRRDAPPPAPSQADLIWFTNQAEFEAFNAALGHVFKGVEDYEESVLDPNSVHTFDDPLEWSVPSAPDGFPFPDGMTGLPNLIVQSNAGGDDPSDEDPSGTSGLVAVSAGFLGHVSDVVLAGFNPHSLDLIFTDEKSGVGFNTTTSGGPFVHVRVYSTANVFLGIRASLADAAGTNFIGVWSPIRIGRINIFDPSVGHEGADNIQAWQEGAPCPADFDDSGDVGVKDLLFLLGAWGPCPKKGDCPADFDISGDVGVKDLLFLLGVWGACP